MVFKLADFKKVIATTELNNIELAEIYGVSRQTIHYWRRVGPPRKGTLTVRVAEKVTNGLLAAVKKKVLPLKPMSREARKACVSRMAARLQGDL